jgi:hypothetical protein
MEFVLLTQNKLTFEVIFIVWQSLAKNLMIP